MARSTSDTQEIIAQVKRSPTAPSPPVSRPPNSNEVPPTVLRAEDVGGRAMQGMYEDHPEVAPAPNPCERCVRTGKTCRGVANARCEYCKRLKQKCSNSTGPARGKHAAAARVAASGASPGKAPLVPHVISSEASAASPMQGLKRKLEDRQDGPSYRRPLGPATAREEEESDTDGHDLPARFNKKRRTAHGSALIASRVMRHVKDLQDTVRRLERVYNAEMERFDTIMSDLHRDLEGLTGESERSEREPSL
ncbi:hypothetical protein DFP72DRAFT_1164470 [Ephemerocybe angulata]|uniref:Zn(2)-C6 fungal-type domain-containing protein n=1 Tax=Ephemerocybe angulata TaxID=980116 RepID=A0A8H6MB12_9AGAR|nr:hypothetical protein DFP72DRAFT_1164470 [Tulosesus angulatus]